MASAGEKAIFGNHKVADTTESTGILLCRKPALYGKRALGLPGI